MAQPKGWKQPLGRPTLPQLDAHRNVGGKKRKRLSGHPAPQDDEATAHLACGNGAIEEWETVETMTLPANP
jgi:hypothetical protein